MSQYNEITISSEIYDGEVCFAKFLDSNNVTTDLGEQVLSFTFSADPAQGTVFVYVPSVDNTFIVVINEPNPCPTVTPTNTPTLTQTPTQTPTDDVTDTPTPTQTQTPTQTPTLTQTPSNTSTETPTNTMTPTTTSTIGVTQTPTLTPTPTSTPIPLVPGNFTFDADYIILTYAFNDGTDLDTRTRVTVPDIGQNSLPDYIGWCCAEQWPTSGNPILTWGGDNTGTGFESVLINLIQFKSDYPGQNIITIDANAGWYGSVGTNPVYIQAKLYKGGTMVADPDNYSFINEGFTAAYGAISTGEVVTLDLFTNCVDGQNVRRLQYNLTNYNGSFI